MFFCVSTVSAAILLKNSFKNIQNRWSYHYQVTIICVHGRVPLDRPTDCEMQCLRNKRNITELAFFVRHRPIVLLVPDERLQIFWSHEHNRKRNRLLGEPSRPFGFLLCSLACNWACEIWMQLRLNKLLFNTILIKICQPTKFFNKVLSFTPA